MDKIKERRQLTHILLKDGRVLVSEASPDDVYNWINTHSHIMIDGEMHSKFDIISAKPVKLNNLESFILAQPKNIQEKLRIKKKWLREQIGREMDYKYAVNFVENLQTDTNADTK